MDAAAPPRRLYAEPRRAATRHPQHARAPRMPRHSQRGFIWTNAACAALPPTLSSEIAHGFLVGQRASDRGHRRVWYGHR